MTSIHGLRIDIARDHVFSKTWGYRINHYGTNLLVTGTNHHVWGDNYETPDDAMSDALKALKAVAAELDARPEELKPPTCPTCGAEEYDEYSPAIGTAPSDEDVAFNRQQVTKNMSQDEIRRCEQAYRELCEATRAV